MQIKAYGNNIYFSSQKNAGIKQSIKNKKTCSITPNNKTSSSSIYETNEHFFAHLAGIKLKIKESREENIFTKFLQQKGKVTLDEYNLIKKELPFIIQKANEIVENKTKVACKPKDMAKLAINIKYYIDNAKELEGKDYRIISIGTSPAPLTEALQNLGCEVIFVPISGINSLVSDKEINCNRNLKLALEYLKSKGVCKEKNNNKKNIVIDYAFSGKTLSTICSFLAKENKLDYKEDIWCLSLIDLMISMLYKKDNKNPIEIPNNEKPLLLKNYREDLHFSLENEISNVPHFDIDDRKNNERTNSISSKLHTKEGLFKAFDEFSKPLARAYSLCVINEMEKLKS